MRRLIVVVSFFLLVSGLLAGPTSAQEASPEAVPGPITLVLIEHATSITNVDGGEDGASAGDMVVWGPNPLFDETNSSDTGATTQGVCTALDETGQCMLIETIIFADGSTLQLQGVQAAGSGDSFRTIVGGSGLYLGATGTVSVEPTDDLATWVKTFEIWL